MLNLTFLVVTVFLTVIRKNIFVRLHEQRNSVAL